MIAKRHSKLRMGLVDSARPDPALASFPIGVAFAYSRTPFPPLRSCKVSLLSQSPFYNLNAPDPLQLSSFDRHRRPSSCQVRPLPLWRLVTASSTGFVNSLQLVRQAALPLTCEFTITFDHPPPLVNTTTTVPSLRNHEQLKRWREGIARGHANSNSAGPS